MNVVVSATPFQLIADPEAKLEPNALRVNAALPTGALCGDIEERIGAVLGWLLPPPEPPPPPQPERISTREMAMVGEKQILLGKAAPEICKQDIRMFIQATRRYRNMVRLQSDTRGGNALGLRA
jgi:hypothetical protein